MRAFGGLLDRSIMESIVAGQRSYQENIKDLPVRRAAPRAGRDRRLGAAGLARRARTAAMQRTVDVVVGRGNLESIRVYAHGQGAYLMTGLIQAFAAHHLVHQPPRKVGFASPGEAFGHREILAALEAYGFVRVEVG